MAEIMDVEFADFIFAGSPVELKRSYRLIAEGTDFAFSGEDVTLLKTYPPLVAETAEFPYVGSDVSLSKNYTLEVENTDFPFEGLDISMQKYYDPIYVLDNEDRYRLFSYNEDILLYGRFAENLWKWSEDLENAPSMTRTLVTLTNNVGTDPDGGNTSARLVGSADSWKFRYNSIPELSDTGDATTSMWVKSNTGASQTFRLQVAGRTSGNLTATTSWQRFSLTNNSVGSTYSGITRNTTLDAVDLLLWHPQVERTTVPSEYIKTTDTKIYKIFGSTNENTVASNIVTENPSVLMEQAPYLFSQFSTTNEVEYASDLTQWTETASATGTTTLTGKGIGNKVNTCTEMDVTVTGTYYARYVDISITSGSFLCSSSLILKDTTSGDVGIELRFDNNIAQRAKASVDPSTGDYSILFDDGSDIFDVEVVDRGRWWQLLFYTNDAYSSSSVRYLIHSIEDGSGNCLIGKTTFDAVQLFKNKTIDEVKNLPPILTNGTTLTVQDKFPAWDASYHTEDQGLYYFEFFYNGGYYDLLKVGDNTLLRTAQIENINDELVDEQPSVANWAIYANNIEEDDVDGSYKITYVDSQYGAACSLTTNSATTRNIETGEKIFIYIDVKVNVAVDDGSIALYFRGHGDTLGTTITVPLYNNDDFITVKAVIDVATDATQPYIRFAGMTTGDIVWIKNLSIHAAQDGVEALSGGTISLPLINGEHNKVGIAYGQDTFDLNLNNRWAPQTSFVPVSGEISTNGIIRDLKHYNNNSAFSREIIEGLM